ncbi:hypothetical protein A5N83_11845 [Rhodococcus sp. 1139]|nr:hypothetical protein A5N83_11845 [Rhodococcus sp. 1139]
MALLEWSLKVGCVIVRPNTIAAGYRTVWSLMCVTEDYFGGWCGLGCVGDGMWGRGAALAVGADRCGVLFSAVTTAV